MRNITAYNSAQLIYNFKNPALTVEIVKKRILPWIENKAEKVYFEDVSDCKR